MNLLGKILVLLILVMSAVFMAFAISVYATHTNWIEVVNRPREQARPGAPAGLKFQLEDARKQRDTLQSELASLQKERDTLVENHQQAIAKLVTERDQLKNDYTTLTATEAKLQEDLRQRTAALGTAQNALNEQNTKVEELRTQVTAAQQARDDQFKKVVELTDQVNRAQGLTQRLEATNVRLAEQNAKAKLLLERVGKNLDTPVDNMPPKIDGVVLAVGREGLLEVSLGSDDGLAQGHTLEVYRNDKYLGRVEVVSTRPDRAVAKVMPDFLQGRIEKEDRVATRLN